VNQQPIPSTDSLCLPLTPDEKLEAATPSVPDSRERASTLIASCVLYAILAWVAWPSLSSQTTALGDDAWIDALRQLSLCEALQYVGPNFWRPGESLMFWMIAHSHSLESWRMGMLVILLLTTAYLQFDASVRSRSYVDGFGAALAFSLNPTTLTVMCWLSAAYISLSAVGILAYVAFARRALTAEASPVRDSAFAALSLMFALAFYELALFAPLFVLSYQWLFVPRPRREALLCVYGGSLVCALVYLALQAQLTELPRFWAHESVPALFVSSMRYVMLNFYLWFNPFETFGALIPDQPTGTELENLVCFALVGLGVCLTWYNRKRDPVTALAGMWFIIFLAPVGTFLRFEGSPIAEQHLYIPMLGVAVGGARMFTRFLESVILRIRNQPARVAFEITLSVFLLWSIAPVVAECRRTVAHWSDTRDLYLTTLQNYPKSAGALAGLTQVLSTQAPHLHDASEEDSTPEWQKVVDAFLLCPKARPASQLLAEGQSLLQEARFLDASSAFARALATSSTAREHLDSGTGLVQALSHTSMRERVPALLERLRLDHPGASLPIN
jgi:hypothetical protein